ncbi:hypothetical protein GLOIN_2v1880882 [Rhizophagus irregularis DAOM 181602=DAOM 197198]|nr:hypothetical protein GLOIN_2v1880882 [Rhizophagus irregularis DAOM 181602=DAOM 197198]GBC32805.2 hypothetical protein GLOIN_2v1880882 [Rhizophagus irregularis DAOM 181602=DAOM 197198]
MNRSKRITRVYASIPKLRVRATNKQRDDEYGISSISNNVLAYSRPENANLLSEESTVSHIPLLNDEQIQLLNDVEVASVNYNNEVLNDGDNEILVNNGNDVLDNSEPIFNAMDEEFVGNGEPLLDIVEDSEPEEDPLINAEILEESSNFKGFDGEYGPYFPNFTSAMLFIWITKHMISTSAYEDLAKILIHPKYQKEDVTTNIRQIRKWRNRLPLAKVCQHDVPLHMQRIPSTYESIRKAFTISPLTHLERILNNPILMSNMYFGPGVVTNERREFWHGEFWQDSPMFGENEIRSNNKVYKAGDYLVYYKQSSTYMCRVRGVVVDETDGNMLKLKVDQLFSHENLPNCRSTDNRHIRGNGKELWLVEGEAKFINPQNIERHITVWLRDMPEPEEYDYYIQEIVYFFNGKWKYRNIIMRHHLPYEYITITQPPPSQRHLPIMKIFLDIYVDDFGTFRNVYHSLGGVYLQIGNMLQSHRKSLKNHFLIGFVPFGANFEDFIKPILQDIKRLESGLVMKTINGDVWIIGGLGCVTADLPQGNDIAGIKRHGANHGCRTCNVSHDQLTSLNYNYIENARFNQQTEERLIEIKNQYAKTRKEQLSTEYGISNPGSFNVLKWDRHIQTPQDAYHSMAGKARTLLEATFNVFNAIGEKEFLKHWKYIEKPTNWSRMPNPIQHRQSFMFSDVLRITMLMPFILRRFLKSHHIKTEALNNWHEKLGIRQNSAVLKLCSCWAIEAKLLKLAFSVTITNNIQQEFQRLLKEEHEILIQARQNYFFLHIFNKIAMVPHINCKVVELDLTRRYNTVQALRHLIDGWIDPRFSIETNALNNLTKDPILYSILSDWYATESSFTFTSIQNNDNESDDITFGVSNFKNIIDISLKDQWSAKKVECKGISKKLDDNHPFYRDLYRAYADYLNSSAAILNKNMEFYSSISYTVIKDNQEPVRLKLHIGDIVDLNEESEGVAYAKIEFIIQHKANNGQYYTFFLFNWFQATNYVDSISRCPLYNIQKPEESQWFQIFPINFIDHVPQVHFIHDCKSTCNSCNTKHDEANRSYILNSFYYTAV